MNVRISTVAVAHGNLSIQIREEQQVSQPLPFAPAATGRSEMAAGRIERADARRGGGGTMMAPGGQTVVTPQSEVVRFTPYFTALISSIVHEAEQQAAEVGGPVSPRLLIALDEAPRP